VPSPANRDVILSNQVSSSRYFFLDLSEAGRGRAIPAYGGFEQCDPAFAVQRVNFPFSTLEMVVGGEGEVWLDGARHPLHAGSVFVYDRSTRLEIRTHSRRPMAKYFLCLAGHPRARLHAAGLRPGTQRRLSMFIEVQRLWDELIREGGRHRRTAGRLCTALTEVLLLKIEELAGLSASPGRMEETTFLRCRELVETRAVSLHSVEDIAAATGLGSTKLTRLFRRYQGLSPYQFLLRRKMAIAAELLINPATLVKQVSAQVGFDSPYHFSRCFKQVHRVSPKDFQRSCCSS